MKIPHTRGCSEWVKVPWQARGARRAPHHGGLRGRGAGARGAALHRGRGRGDLSAPSDIRRPSKLHSLPSVARHGRAAADRVRRAQCARGLEERARGRRREAARAISRSRRRSCAASSRRACSCSAKELGLAESSERHPGAARRCAAGYAAARVSRARRGGARRQRHAEPRRCHVDARHRARGGGASRPRHSACARSG